MNIKILETKLQTILEDDSFEITEENISKKIEEIFADAIIKFARLNEATTDIEYFRDEYYKDITDVEDKEIFEIAIRGLICVFENDCYYDKNKVIEIITELFTNQDFYDLMKNNFPSIIKLVDKLNSSECIFELEDIMNWLKDGFDSINMENIEDITAFEYLNIEFEDFNNLFVPDKDVAIVSNKK
jgi:hypothetical protein